MTSLGVIIGFVLGVPFGLLLGGLFAFQKLPALSRLAPTQSEPPFLVAQLIVMVIFVVLGIRAGIGFRPMATRPA